LNGVTGGNAENLELLEKLEVMSLKVLTRSPVSRARHG